MREYKVSIKGPLNTPVGGGIRSLNVVLRQALDLFVCLRPVQVPTHSRSLCCLDRINPWPLKNQLPKSNCPIATMADRLF